MTDTPEFKRWFGDSKAVDEKGKPLVVYHGTDAEFTTFSKRPPRRNFYNGQRFLGFFFTADAAYADQYATQNGKIGKVLPVVLSLQDPAVVPISRIDEIESMSDSSVKKWKQRLIDKGHDGIIFKGNTFSEYVAFNPTQIKSATGNRGTFDPADPDITMSRRRRVARRLGFDLEEAALEPCGARCAPEHDAEEAQVVQRASVAP